MNSVIDAHSNRKTWDKLGIALSGACLLHCLFVVALPMLIPALSFFIHNPWVHRCFAVFILAITPMAFIPGYRKHGLTRVMIQAYVGVAFILLGVLLDGMISEAPAHGLSMLGSIGLVGAHIQNIRHSHRKNCCK